MPSFSLLVMDLNPMKRVNSRPHVLIKCHIYLRHVIGTDERRLCLGRHSLHSAPWEANQKADRRGAFFHSDGGNEAFWSPESPWSDCAENGSLFRIIWFRRPFEDEMINLKEFHPESIILINLIFKMATSAGQTVGLAFERCVTSFNQSATRSAEEAHCSKTTRVQ